MELKKDDIVRRLRQRGYTKNDSYDIIDDVFAVITKALVDGDSVHIHGFGTFSVVVRPPRESISVVTGKRILLDPCTVPKFTPGLLLRRVIKEGIVREE